MTTVGVVANIMSGCSKLTLAKFIDIFGRIEGFLLMLTVSVISLILKALCRDIEMYFAAHTLYWIGHIGLIVCLVPKFTIVRPDYWRADIQPTVCH